MISLGVFCPGFLPRCSAKIRVYHIDPLTFNWSQPTDEKEFKCIGPEAWTLEV